MWHLHWQWQASLGKGWEELGLWSSGHSLNQFLCNWNDQQAWRAASGDLQIPDTFVLRHTAGLLSSVRPSGMAGGEGAGPHALHNSSPSPPSAASQWSCQGAIAHSPFHSSVSLTAPSARPPLWASQTAASVPGWPGLDFSADGKERIVLSPTCQGSCRDGWQTEFHSHTTKQSDLLHHW